LFILSFPLYADLPALIIQFNPIKNSAKNSTYPAVFTDKKVVIISPSLKSGAIIGVLGTIAYGDHSDTG